MPIRGRRRPWRSPRALLELLEDSLDVGEDLGSMEDPEVEDGKPKVLTEPDERQESDSIRRAPPGPLADRRLTTP